MTQNIRGKILVVDDDRLVLATLAHGLAQAGHEVIDADNGDDAILLAREHRPDLALLDIRMQGMSGFDVAAYLREHCHVPFIFLSAFSDAQTVAQVTALGALAYLVKPLDIGQILPVVDAALTGIQARRSAGQATPLALSDAPADAEPRADQGTDQRADHGTDHRASDTSEASAVGLAAAAGAALEPATLLAIGVLMHRHSLSRGAAEARLQRFAKADGRSVAEQALRVVDAIELLAASDGA